MILPRVNYRVYLHMTPLTLTFVVMRSHDVVVMHAALRYLPRHVRKRPAEDQDGVAVDQLWHKMVSIKTPTMSAGLHRMTTCMPYYVCQHSPWNPPRDFVSDTCAPRNIIDELRCIYRSMIIPALYEKAQAPE